MADRKLIVEIVGDASSLHKSFQKAQQATTGFDRSMKNAGRGALSASVSFAGLRRSVLSTSAAFLGGVGIVASIKSTISAAEESQRVLAQTQQAVDNSGQSWQTYGKLIQDAALATANLSGFDDERLLGTFSALVRRTHDVNEALRLNALAADVARGRNIELEQASQLVLKASLGQAGALRRVGIAAKQGATATELLTMLQKSFAGSAEAYGKTAAGAQDRFRVALENTQEVIGQALLPSLTKVLDKATAWLNNQEHQKQIQEGVNNTVEGGAKTAGFLADAWGKVSPAVDLTVKYYETWYRAQKKVDTAVVSTTGHLTGLDTLLSEKPKPGWWQNFFDQITALANAGPLKVLDQIEAARRQRTADFGADVPLPLQKGTANVGGPPPTAAQLRAIALAQTAGTGTAAEVAAIKAQIDADRAAIEFAKRRIDQQRGNRRKFADALTRLYTDLNAQQAKLASIAQDNAAKAKAAADAVKAAAAKRRQAITDMANEALSGVDLGIAGGALTVADINKAVAANEARAREAAAKARQSAQFRALGLTSTGEALAPTRKALQAGLASIQKSLGGTILDTDKNRNLLSRIRKVLSGQFGALTRETRLKIKELEDALRGDKKAAGGPLTDVQAVTGRKLAQMLGARLGLTPEQVRQLRLNVTGAHFATGSLAGAAGFSPTIQTRVDIDGRQVALATHQHSERARRRTAPQTRGRVLP